MGASESQPVLEEISFADRDVGIEGTVQRMKLRRLHNMDESTIERVTRINPDDDPEENFGTDTELSAEDGGGDGIQSLTVSSLERHNRQIQSHAMVVGVAQKKPAPPNQWNASLKYSKTKKSSAVESSTVNGNWSKLDHLDADKPAESSTRQPHNTGISIEEERTITTGCASCIDAPLDMIVSVLSDVIATERIANTSHNKKL